MWVKKIVKEEYMRKVPVKRTRRVKRPKEMVEEVEDFAVVRVKQLFLVLPLNYPAKRFPVLRIPPTFHPLSTLYVAWLQINFRFRPRPQWMSLPTASTKCKT